MLPTLTLIVPCTTGTRDVDPRLQVAGRPLIDWTLDAARQATVVDRLFVVTNDPKVSELAWAHEAESIARPVESEDEPASLETIGLHVLGTLAKSEGFHPEFVIFLDPAFPLLAPTDIETSIALLRERNADSVFSATPLTGYVWRRREGEWVALERDYHDPQRHETATDSVVENGAIYAIRPRVLQRTHNRVGGKIVVYRMRFERTLRIQGPRSLDLVSRLCGT